MTFFSNPKRKDYVLNPRGKALYDDSNRFGTKMLEKMGWTKGKGLGANLDGQLNFIKVSHKGDQKGVGFQDRDDQWTSHESNFNSLLKSFKSTDTTDSSDEDVEDFSVQGFRNDNKAVHNEENDKKVELFSGISLEEQSKKSRARVHYKKFTRGKDLSRYSEKDLANIFGKKTLTSTVETDKTENVTSGALTDEATPNFGITTVETGTTINDYFKSKMKNMTSGENSVIENVMVAQNTVDDAKSEKKKRKKLKTDSTACEQQVPETNSKDVEVSYLDDKSEINVIEKRSQSLERENIAKRKHDSDALQPANRSKKKKKNDRPDGEDDTAQIHLEQSSSSQQSKEDDQIVETFGESSEKQINRKRLKKSKKAEREKDAFNMLSTPTEPSNEATQFSTNLFNCAADGEAEENRSVVFNDNIFTINGQRAEIFRYVDLHGFAGSTLCDIPGYGYTKDMQLKIVERPNDSKLIDTLWSEALDKYAHLKDGKKIKKKKKFVEHIQGLKKKNVFKI